MVRVGWDEIPASIIPTKAGIAIPAYARKMGHTDCYNVTPTRKNPA